MVSKPQQYAAEVREHYEELPYPYVDVALEREQFAAADSYGLDALNHYGWAGRRDLRQARFLVAGEGTGDMTVFFAEQLRGTDAEIVAVDLSTASIDVAKARLKKRGLTNVTHHHMSLLDLSAAEFGKFDVIECGGVLHHLPDPDAGLRVLTSMLADDGLMAIMVYAQYGRMAIYMIQDLMRRLLPQEASRVERIAATRAFLHQMPRSHWFAESNARFINDIQYPDGSGIYDLFLHSNDRAYTVPQIYAWLDQAKLELVSFFDEQKNESMYQPEYYSNQSDILASVRDKPARERHAIAELMHGNMYKHHFYAAKEPKAAAMLADDMVIVWGMVQGGRRNWVAQMQKALENTSIGSHAFAEEQQYGLAPMTVTKQEYTGVLLGNIDGKKTVGEMVAEVASVSGAASSQIRAQLSLLYKQLFNNNRVFLRHHSIAPYVTMREITERLKTIPEIR